MSKAPSPLLGYNNNVRHKNRVFHIQTEDSGVKHPHIITHIFMDGGRILKSVKASYADHVGEEKLGDVVRQMMKDQHKAMFRALRDGELDAIIDDAITASASARASRAPPAPPPPASEEPPPATTRDVAPAPLTLDLDAALDVAQPGFQPQADLPPPPANVLAARAGGPGTGRYATLEEREEHAPISRPSRKSERPPPRSERPRAATKRSERPPRQERAGPRDERAPSSRHAKRVDPRAEPESEPKQPVASQSARPGRAPAGAAVRPAAIFGQARPQQSSIFGEDIISDKSLDEVILSYLAEDLEEGSK